MATSAYWRMRAEANMDAMQELADERIERIGRAHAQAARDLTEQAQRILGRYAKRFDLSREDALAALNAPFDEDSRAYGYRMTRAEAMREAAKETAERLMRLERREVEALHGEVAGESYRRAGDLAAGMRGISFNSPHEAGLKRSVDTRWAGGSYSKRIWSNTDELAKELDKEITAAYLSGKSNTAISQAISDRFGVSFRQAERLVRTETSYVTNRAAVEAYLDAGLEEFEVLTADKGVCEHCAKHNRKRVRLAHAEAGVNLPPFHPWCRCDILPVVELEDEENHEREEHEKSEGGGEARKGAAVAKSPVGSAPAPEHPKETGGAGVRRVGRIDRDIYRCVTPDITTDEVVITEERIAHCNRHAGAYDRYAEYIQLVLSDPDIIFADTRPNTGILIRETDIEGKSLQLVLRLHTSDDDPNYQNSIISLWDISESRRRNYEKNKHILYKRE